MKITKFAIILFLALSPMTLLFSQSKDVEVIEFDDDGDSQSKSKSRYGMVIKTNPFSVINSWNFIEVEKPLNGLFSLQGGLGVTYGYRILSLDYANNDGFDFGSSNSDYRNNKIGTYLSLSPKVYFAEDSPDGSYISIAVTLANRKSESLQIIDDGFGNYSRSLDTYDDEKQTDISLTGRWGYQYLYETLSVEYFLGVGILKSTGEKVYDGDYNNNTNSYEYGLGEINKQSLLLELGVRIGFQL